MRIKRQRETFAYRVAGPFDLFDMKPPSTGNGKSSLDALPKGGEEAAARFNARGEAEQNRPGTKMPKMVVTPGAPSGSSAGSNGVSTSGGGASGLRGTGGSGVTKGDNTGGSLLPQTDSLRKELLKMYPGAEIGGWREPDGYNEHSSGHALDFMTTDNAQARAVMQKAFDSGANYVIWQGGQHNPDGSFIPYNRTGDPRLDHFDHVHINI